MNETLVFKIDAFNVNLKSHCKTLLPFCTYVITLIFFSTCTESKKHTLMFILQPMLVNQKFWKFLNFQFLVTYSTLRWSDCPFGKSKKSLEILRNKKNGDSQNNLYCCTEFLCLYRKSIPKMASH